MKKDSIKNSKEHKATSICKLKVKTEWFKGKNKVEP